MKIVLSVKFVIVLAFTFHKQDYYAESRKHKM